jgi:hypothetical protein
MRVENTGEGLNGGSMLVIFRFVSSRIAWFLNSFHVDLAKMRLGYSITQHVLL